MSNLLIHADCLTGIDTLENASIDLVFTSPPYAEQRKGLYDSINEKEYPEWTVKWFEKCKRVLKPEGSIAFVIRPHLKDGVISDYVLKTRLLLREKGWKECEEFIWIKPNSPPVGSNLRPRRAWESVHWFSLTNKPYIDPKANGTFSKRLGFEGKKGKGKYINGLTLSEDWQDRCGVARCKDYVEVGTAESDYSDENKHPAQFPERLALWFVTMLCPEGGTVLDPFVGSGTTPVACVKTGRNYVGFDTDEGFLNYAKKRVWNSLVKI
jgi:DNA modification methylase